VLPRGYVFMSGGVNFFDKGIWVMDPGTRWDAHGAPVTRTWSKLDADSAAGAATVTVKDNVTDWFIGGDVVVTQTSNPLRARGACSYKSTCAYFFENETRKIVSVTPLAGGRTAITLDRPLAYAHQGTGRTRGEVGLLTRNILVRTEVTGVPDATLDTDVRERTFSHTMFVHGGKGDIQYTEFKYMGNLAQLARYPIHFHKVGFAGNGAVIRGNSIWRSGNRGYQPHNSQGILFEDNVAFDTVMSPFYVERAGGSGSTVINRLIAEEAPNDIWFVHNLGVQSTPAPTVGTAQQNDAAIFWLENLDQVMLGNVAVGAGAYSGAAGEVPIGGIPPTGGGDDGMGFFPSIRSDQTGGIRPPTYRKNEFHSNGLMGMRFWNRNGVQPYDFVDISTWRNGQDGISWGYYRSPHKVYQLEAIENTTGIGASNIVGTGSRFVQDAVITGNKVGIEQPYSISTSIYPDRPWIYTRVYLDNTDADISRGARICPDAAIALWTIASRYCHPGYTLMIDPVFNSSTPIGLGIGQHLAAEANGSSKNTMWRIKGATGLDASYPDDFLLMRPDQIDPLNQTPFTRSFLTGSKELITNPEALRVDVSTLPNTITNDIFGNNDSFRTDLPFLTHTYTWEKDVDVPPKVSMSMSLSGKVANLTATATDDKRVGRVEFWVDDHIVATDNDTPYTAAVDLSNHPTRYAYVYAVAYDDRVIPKHWNTGFAGGSPAIFGADYDQRAYSKVAVVGPEVLDTGQVIPPLPPTRAVFKKNPVGWWQLDDGAGNIALDSSGSRYDGVLVGGPTWITGKTGSALLFDGVDDSLNLDYNLDEPVISQAITVAAWINPNPVSLTNIKTGMTSGADPGKPSAGLTINGAAAVVKGNKLPAANTWYHIAFTYDASTMRLYVNGAEEGAVNISGTFEPGQDTLRIGYGVTSTRFWDGAIDDVRLYNRALSPAEINQIMTTSTRILKIGDLNRDGRVNILDVSRLLSKWGSVLAADLKEGDISDGAGGSSSGKIDIFDANKLMANWTG
jgi:hypothetical protein